MESNIYDLTISELILKAGGGSGGSGGGSNVVPRVVLTNSLGVNELEENYNGSIAYTSTVVNIPSGYSVQASSHVISYPNGAPDTIGSTDTLTGASTTIILGAVGSTFVVTTTVTLSNGVDPDIVLNGSHTMTAVLPMYYGVKANSLTPDITGLSKQANTNLTFSMTNSIFGRIYIVMPVGTSPIVSVTESNGIIYPVSDFNIIVSGSFTYYILKWDTQLTGTNLKYFTINFS
jgi:hypothetical protein